MKYNSNRTVINKLYLLGHTYELMKNTTGYLADHMSEYRSDYILDYVTN